MFINQEPHEIDDFLKAVNFVAPKGMSLKYFIVPYAANGVNTPNGLNTLAGANNFTPEVNPNKVKGITDTIVYKKRDLKDRQSFNDANFNINQIPGEFPITRPQQAQISSNLEPMQSDLIAAGADIYSPVKGVQIVESTSKVKDLLLTETIGPFPKNTLLHFEKSLLAEGLQYGKGSNPPTEKDEEIAEKFCILMDWEITPDDIWQVYDYGDGKATISVTKDMTAAMTDGEVSDLDDVYYYDYENDCIISKESEDLAKMQDEDDFADRDMGEMYGNYRGDASFFESKQKIYEATEEVKTDPQSLIWELYDEAFNCDDEDIHWVTDDFYSTFNHYYCDEVKTWADFISEAKYEVERIEKFCNEVQLKPGATEKIKNTANQVLACIHGTGDESKEAANTEALKEPKDIISAIESANVDDVISAYQIGKNIFVDLDTEDEDEAEEIASQIEFDILNNGRKHGRDDLQGMGQWHLNVGTVAEFSEDNYNDLDPDVRDQYQIIIEPAESYKTRREMGW